jgi:hypothetical protein
MAPGVDSPFLMAIVCIISVLSLSLPSRICIRIIVIFCLLDIIPLFLSEESYVVARSYTCYVVKAARSERMCN